MKDPGVENPSNVEENPLNSKSLAGVTVTSPLGFGVTATLGLVTAALGVVERLGRDVLRLGSAGLRLGDAGLRLGNAGLRLGDVVLRLGNSWLRLGNSWLRLGKLSLIVLGLVDSSKNNQVCKNKNKNIELSSLLSFLLCINC